MKRKGRVEKAEVVKMASEEEELERLRQQRLQQLLLQQQAAAEQQALREEAERQQIEEAKRIILRQLLTPEARERLTNIKLAKPELATQIENLLVALAQSGKITKRIDDAQLKEILRRVMPKKREISIRRI